MARHDRHVGGGVGRGLAIFRQAALGLLAVHCQQRSLGRLGNRRAGMGAGHSAGGALCHECPRCAQERSDGPWSLMRHDLGRGAANRPEMSTACYAGQNSQPHFVCIAGSRRRGAEPRHRRCWPAPRDLYLSTYRSSRSRSQADESLAGLAVLPLPSIHLRRTMKCEPARQTSTCGCREGDKLSSVVCATRTRRATGRLSGHLETKSPCPAESSIR